MWGESMRWPNTAPSAKWKLTASKDPTREMLCVLRSTFVLRSSSCLRASFVWKEVFATKKFERRNAIWSTRIKFHISMWSWANHQTMLIRCKTHKTETSKRVKKKDIQMADRSAMIASDTLCVTGQKLLLMSAGVCVQFGKTEKQFD